MGTDYYGKLGPYIVCKFDNVAKSRKYNGCVNGLCYESESKNATSNKYCGACGKKCGEKTEVFQGEIDPYPLLAQMNEALHLVCIEGYEPLGSNTHVFIPNTKIKAFCKNFEFKYETGGITDLTEIDVDNELANFENQFPKELEILRKNYCEVTLHWGFIHYLN